MYPNRIDEVLNRAARYKFVPWPKGSLVSVDMRNRQSPTLEIASTLAPGQGIWMGPYPLVLAADQEVGVELVGRNWCVPRGLFRDGQSLGLKSKASR